MRTSIAATLALLVATNITHPAHAVTQAEHTRLTLSAGQCYASADTARYLTGNANYEVVLRWNGTESNLHRVLIQNKADGHWVLMAQEQGSGNYCIMAVGQRASTARRFADFSTVLVPCDQQVRQLRQRPFEVDGNVNSVAGWDASTARAIGRLDELARTNGWDRAMRDRQEAAMREFRSSLGMPSANYCASQRSLPLSQMLSTMFPSGPIGQIFDGEVLQVVGEDQPDRIVLVHGRSEGQAIGSPVWAFSIFENGQSKVSFSGVNAAVGRPAP